MPTFREILYQSPEETLHKEGYVVRDTIAQQNVQITYGTVQTTVVELLVPKRRDHLSAVEISSEEETEKDMWYLLQE